VTLLEVVSATDGPDPFFRCAEIRQRGRLPATPEQCREPCAVARAMAIAEQAWRDALAGITIADVATEIDSDSAGALSAVDTWLRSRRDDRRHPV